MHTYISILLYIGEMRYYKNDLLRGKKGVMVRPWGGSSFDSV